ncbi:site-specific recombinase xerd [Halobacteriales archaeon QH_10_67_22]|nr:MAG: site-specific recombinase xerd [Halobacteriales archaeon QH_10_67_22]
MSIDGIPVVPEPTQDRLEDRKLVDYRDHRERFIEWCLSLGKNPKAAEGYSPYTVKNRAYRTDTFYRWVWDETGSYTTQVTHEHADDYTRELAYGDSSASHKADTQKALKMLFRWRADALGEEEWEPKLVFNDNSSKATQQDYLTHDERKQIREAALDYGSIPSYNTVGPDDRIALR